VDVAVDFSLDASLDATLDEYVQCTCTSTGTCGLHGDAVAYVQA